MLFCRNFKFVVIYAFFLPNLHPQKCRVDQKKKFQVCPLFTNKLRSLLFILSCRFVKNIKNNFHKHCKENPLLCENTLDTQKTSPSLYWHNKTPEYQTVGVAGQNVIWTFVWGPHGTVWALSMPSYWSYKYQTGYWTISGGRPTTAIVVDQHTNIACICNISWKYTHTHWGFKF